MTGTLNGSITLGTLLKGHAMTDANKECVITGLSLDSRTVKPGDLFFAYPGETADGRQYIIAAIEKGAVAAVVEVDEGDEFDLSAFSIPVIVVANLKLIAGHIAAVFWGSPSDQMAIVAVTGTNGKTSVTQMIAESVELLEKKAAVIGTLGNGVLGSLKETKNTTPDALQVQQLLAEFSQAGVSLVAMEASSHGLVQGRLSGTNITIGVVTNISRDHLDYHGSMEAYRRAKADLVMWPGIRQVILNADDKDVMALSSNIAEGVEIVTFSHAGIEASKEVLNTSTPVADIRAEDIVYSKQGLTFTLVTPTGKGQVKNQLVGEFNVSNLLAVAAVLYCQRFDHQHIVRALSSISQVPGRMQEVGTGISEELPGVVVDFAHTPDALEKALTALKPHSHGKLWCVFGCGGERDKGKRPEMGAIAVKYADRVVITADNPRTESIEEIVHEIENGIELGAAYQVEQNRTEAVRYAILSAANDDLILLAGKGHENYQETNGEKHPYSDREVAEKTLRERSQRSIAGDSKC